MDDKIKELFEAQPFAEIEDYEPTVYCEIDVDDRTISIPDEYTLAGVEADNDVKRIFFRCNKISQITDLSTFTVYINYMNANGDEDRHICDDVEVRDNELYFSWLVSNFATAYKGNIRFIVCMIDDANNLHWNTTVASIEVLEGLETSETIVEQNPDIIENMLLELQDHETRITNLEAGGGTGGTVSVRVGTTTTGEPGTDAVVTNSGTNQNAVFDFVIPRGQTGATGPQGPQGERGPQGPAGPSGSKEILYNKAIFIGDSTSQGYDNEDYSFVDIFEENGDFGEVIKLAVGGATLGPYQIVEAANGYSCIEQVQNNIAEFDDADVCFIQFCVNDIQCLKSGNITMGSMVDTSAEQTIIGYIKKIIETIYARNPLVKIYFLNLTINEDVMNLIWSGKSDVESYVLYNKMWNNYAVKVWRQYNIPVINIVDDINFNDINAEDYTVTTSDGSHMNTNGNKNMYHKIKASIDTKSDEVESSQIKDYVIEINTQTRDSSVDPMVFEMAYEYLLLGADVSVRVNNSIVVPISEFGSNYLIFSKVYFDSSKLPRAININIAKNGVVTSKDVSLSGTEGGGTTTDLDFDIAEEYIDIKDTTKDYVLCLKNNSVYGDGGNCWFGVRTGETIAGVQRTNGTYVFPLVNQADLPKNEVPYGLIMDVAKTYVGRTDLVYGFSTLFNTECTNEIDCSAYIAALLEGVKYEKSRYVEENNSNTFGENLGDNLMPNSQYSNRTNALTSYEMARWFAENKRLFELPSDWKTACNMLQFGDILFSGTNDEDEVIQNNRYYGIGHCLMVLAVDADNGKVMVTQAGGAGSSLLFDNESTVVKTSTISLNNNIGTYYRVFARPCYGNYKESNESEPLINAVLNDSYRIKDLDFMPNMTIDSSSGRKVYSESFFSDWNFIPVIGGIIVSYDGKLQDENQVNYMSMVAEYDENKSFIKRTTILNESVKTDIALDADTRFIRCSFGHALSLNTKTLLSQVKDFAIIIKNQNELPDDYDTVKSNSERIWIDKTLTYTIASNKAGIFDAVENSKADKMQITDGSEYWDADENAKYPSVLSVKQLRNNRFYANMWLPNNLDMEQDYRYNVDKNGQIRLYNINGQKSDLTSLSPWGICLRAEGKSFPTTAIHFILSTFKILGLHSVTGKWEVIRNAKPIASLFDIAHTSTDGHVIDVQRTDLGNDMFSFAINNASNWKVDGEDMCFHFFLEQSAVITKEDVANYDKIIVSFNLKVQESQYADVFTCSAGCDALGSSTSVEAFFSRFNAVTDRLLEYNANNCLESEAELITDQLYYIDALLAGVGSGSSGGGGTDPGGGNSHTELARIGIDKNCYFDTEIAPNINSKVEIKVRVTSAEESGTWIWGVRDAEDKYTLSVTNNWYCARGSLSSAAGQTDYWDDPNGWTISQDGKTFDFNGTAVQLSDISSLDFSQTAYIGNCNNNGSPYTGQGYNGEFYYCKMYNGSDLVSDIIPVKKSDSTICLYDKVRKKYLYNKGTGSLTEL